MRSQDTETEHQVRAFSSWGNPSAPPYKSNENRHNTLMRVQISPNDQRTIKTNRQNQEYKNKVHNGKMNQNEMFCLLYPPKGNKCCNTCQTT